MFRIWPINDCTLPIEREFVTKVQQILRDQFPLVPAADIDQLPQQLRDPLQYRFRTTLFVAGDGTTHVKGFAVMLHMPDLHFCYLDFISAARLTMSRGIGSALYERVREEARNLGSMGLFFECLPDDPALCHTGEHIKDNASRLRFYEHYGARPIVGTAFEMPLKPDSDCPPFLVFDGLGENLQLPRDRTRRIVRAILERRYASSCPPKYIDFVVDSFRDDPLRVREPRYVKLETPVPVRAVPSVEKTIVLVVNDLHHIHHVRERGYVESPVRVSAILRDIEPTGLFERVEPRHFASDKLRAVHDVEYLNYLKRVCAAVAPDESVYPYVFPLRNATRPPLDLPTRAGYYCIDTFTPLNRNAYPAARRGVDCALTAAERLLRGSALAYALVRPPGHHAERRAFGGFCYLNSAAIAAHDLSRFGRIAVLDVDYHHGNGTQNAFYDRADVLTVSIHGHPRFAYPYFSGFADEKGHGPGEGFNINMPLPEEIDGARYRQALHEALGHVTRFAPRFLVVALGLDTAKGDPTGTWSLRAGDFQENGRMIGRLRIPTLVVQEGGYRTRSLGPAARAFFLGLWDGFFAASRAALLPAPPAPPAPNPSPPGSPAATTPAVGP